MEDLQIQYFVSSSENCKLLEEKIKLFSEFFTLKKTGLIYAKQDGIYTKIFPLKENSKIEEVALRNLSRMTDVKFIEASSESIQLRILDTNYNINFNPLQNPLSYF